MRYIFIFLIVLLPTIFTQSNYNWNAYNHNLPLRTDAAIDSNGRSIILATGGRINGIANNDVFVSSDSKTWIQQSKSSGTSYFTARHSHGLSYCGDSINTFYIYGGQASNGANLADLWKSNIVGGDTATTTYTSKWTKVTKSSGTSPGSRSGLQMMCISGKIYIMGCYCSGTGAKTLYIYTVASNSWSSVVNNYVTSLSRFSTFYLPTTKHIAFVSGLDNNYATYLFLTTSNTWSTLTTTNNPSIYYSAFTTNTNKKTAYLIGGLNSGSGSNSNNVYIAYLASSNNGENLQWSIVNSQGLPTTTQLIINNVAAIYLSNTQNQLYLIDFKQGKSYITNIPSCATSNQCQNGGTCIDQLVGTTCDCSTSSGYQGSTCSEPDMCHQPATSCSNHGQCIVTSSTTRTCNCYSGWKGENCEVPNLCVATPNVCNNRGQCTTTDNPNGYYCTCNNGYFGSDCQWVDACFTNPCQNGATCNRLGNNQYSCTNCPEAYYGPTCSLPNPCVVQPYSLQLMNACGDAGFADCTNTMDGNFTCTCLDPNYSGDRCQNFNPCATKQAYCQANFNNATCVLAAISGGFECQCPVNWGGFYCDVYNPCLLNSSLCGVDVNHGVCYFNPTAAGHPYYTSCICNRPPKTPEFWYNLEVDCQYWSYCKSSSSVYPRCVNGGICQDIFYTRGEFTCNCPQGFNGTYCENPI